MGGEFSSRKVTSRRDEADLRKSDLKNSISGVNPGEYMKLSNKSYYQEFERPKGSFYTQGLHDNMINEGEELKKTTKAKLYLRGLNFGFIKDSYNKNISSGSS